MRSTGWYWVRFEDCNTLGEWEVAHYTAPEYPYWMRAGEWAHNYVEDHGIKEVGEKVEPSASAVTQPRWNLHS